MRSCPEGLLGCLAGYEGVPKGCQRVGRKGSKRRSERDPKGVLEALKRVSERWVSWGIIGSAGFGYDLGMT